ncbi:hypothetical protein [Methylobacterium sp. E-045]|uniref:hypothetical protein n=1 Tax=Methylobacterium sp. E-045 TaxID=2836575 RepID=UPI001FBB3CAC|nr:hypothetical protein [Methylobacterium sp. E-045]MCJ2131591.1 hypothetical protein [Methylobacterium sp. E-045]
MNVCADLSAIAPYSRAETAAAASWVRYIDQAITAGGEPAAAIVEAIDKLYRRGLVTESVAALLSEIFDVPHCAVLELA